MKKIILVNPDKDVVIKAKNNKLYIIIIDGPNELNEDTIKLAQQSIIIDWRAKDNYNIIYNICQAIHNELNIDAVFAVGEKAIELAAFLSDKLEVIGNSYNSIMNSKNKLEFRKLLNSHGISPIRYTVCNDINFLNQSISEVELPVIVKPYDGSGSEDVFKLSNEEDIKFIKEKIKDKNNKFIIEEYIDGEEYSAEALSFDGEHNLITITKKRTTGEPNFIEVGHQVPVQINNYDEVKETIFKTLDVVGHMFGPSHTEFKITSKGIKIIETHSRVGGDHIDFLVKNSLGVDLIEDYFKSIINNKLDIKSNFTCYTGIYYIILKKGLVESIDGLDYLNSHDNIIESKLYFEVGQNLAETVDSYTRHGHFIIKSENEELLNSTIEEVNNRLRIGIISF